MIRLLILVLVWLLWSGHHSLDPEKPLIAILGALSCAAVALLSERMRKNTRVQYKRTLGPATLLYLPWLLWEIVKSNLLVARVILMPSMPINRRIIKIEANQRGEGARVLFANSITLTPGTISLSIEDDSIFVHVIIDELAEDLQTGAMGRRVKALETAP